MQKKKVLIILLLIILSSYFVYAYSAREFLEDYKNLISGKAIEKQNKENFFEKIGSFFKNLFKKESVGTKINDKQELEVSKLNNELLQVNEEYKQINDEEKLNELIEISKERKEKLISLMRENPKKALEIVIDEQVRDNLPLEVQGNIEEKVEQEGTLNVMHTDDFENPENSKYFYYLVDENFNKVNIYPSENLNLISNTQVRLKGYQLENNLLTEANQENLQVLSSPEIAEDNLGEQKTIVILMNWIDEKGILHSGITKEEAEKAVFQEANDYFKENSYGKAWLTGKVVGPYQTKEKCSELEAIKLADPDVYFPNYDRIIIFYPFYLRQNGICGFDGVSDIGKKIFTVDGKNIKVSYSLNLRKDLWVVGHELGHQFGEGHSDLLDCSNIGYFNIDKCNVIEYGDPFDIMGNVGTRNRGLTPHLNAYHKRGIGWISKEDSVITTNGEYSLTPIELSSYGAYGIKLIKIPITSNPSIIFWDETSYYLEYRQPIGFDNNINDDLYKGVLFHVAHSIEGLGRSSYIYYPNSITIKEGETFNDGLYNVSIKVLSIDKSNAKVKIMSNLEPSLNLKTLIDADRSIVNQPVNIKTRFVNYGTGDILNIKYELYQIDIGTGNLILINTKEILVLKSNDELTINDEIIINEVGISYYQIKLKLDNNSINSQSLSKKIKTKFNGPYINNSHTYFTKKDLYLGQTSEVVIDVSNYWGGEDAINTKISVYGAEKNCNAYGCEYKKGNLLKEDSLDILSIDEGGWQMPYAGVVVFDYTPKKSGINGILVIIDHPNNLNPQKEFYYEVDVKSNEIKKFEEK